MSDSQPAVNAIQRDLEEQERVMIDVETLKWIKTQAYEAAGASVRKLSGTDVIKLLESHAAMYEVLKAIEEARRSIFTEGFCNDTTLGSRIEKLWPSITAALRVAEGK